MRRGLIVREAIYGYQQEAMALISRQTSQQASEVLDRDMVLLSTASAELVQRSFVKFNVLTADSDIR